MARGTKGVRINLLPVGDRTKIPTLSHLSKWLTDEGLRQFAKDEIQNRYQKLTDGWKHRPDFKLRATIQGGEQFGVWVYPSGPNAQIYKWVSGGTPPHLIVGGSKLLKFQPHWNARTRPMKLTNWASWYVPPTKYARLVHNPGITPRFFELVIAKEAQPVMAPILQRYIDTFVSAPSKYSHMPPAMRAAMEKADALMSKWKK